VFGGVIWDIGSTGTTGGDVDYIVKSIEEMVDKFCLDYLKANPK
jgi:hypothetical protein